MFKKLLGTLLFVVAASFSATSWAQVIGYVHEVKGDVTLRATASGQPTKAAAGDTFQQGAGVTTGADGNVTLKFEDGQLAVLAPNSQFVATTYVFNKTRVADSNILFSLARGGLRFVSGVIAATNSTKFAVRTPTATAGVRGTDGTIMFADGVTIATTGNGTLVLSVPPPAGSPPGTPPTVVSIPPGTTSVASGTSVSQPAPTATVTVPPALTALAVTIRAIAAAPVAASNTPVNPVATGNAVRAAVALAVAVATGATPAQIATLQAAANTANQNAVTQNNVTATQAAAAGAIQAPPPATPVNDATGTTPPPVTVTTPPPPPVTTVVPSGS